LHTQIMTVFISQCEALICRHL